MAGIIAAWHRRRFPEQDPLPRGNRAQAAPGARDRKTATYEVWGAGVRLHPTELIDLGDRLVLIADMPIRAPRNRRFAGRSASRGRCSTRHAASFDNHAPMDLGLKGKACIVTGASRGIGAAAARMLAEEGANVLTVARGGADVELDLTERDSADKVVAECERRHGAVDVVVNNAGTSHAKPLDELTDEDWRGQWELHVMVPMRIMRAAAPRMARRGGGRIVNVGSSAGKRPSLTNAAYSVTKAAELSLSRVFADAWARKGVLVNSVTPGPVKTSLWLAEGGLADQVASAQGISRQEALEAAREKIPLGRFGTDEEIAAAIVFLCSERASNVTGAAWSVDGGSVPVII